MSAERRGRTLSIVRTSQDLLLRLERMHHADGSEDLLLVDPRLVGNIDEDGRFDEISFLSDSRTSHDELAVLLADIDVAQNGLSCWKWNDSSILARQGEKDETYPESHQLEVRE